jgi:hypothetical protein
VKRSEKRARPFSNLLQKITQSIDYEENDYHQPRASKSLQTNRSPFHLHCELFVTNSYATFIEKNFRLIQNCTGNNTYDRYKTAKIS